MTGAAIAVRMAASRVRPTRDRLALLVRTIPADAARRIALAAQGLADPRPAGRVDVRHLRRVMRRVGVVQLDSVNVAVRTHYMPFFSRLGPYPLAMLDEFAYRRRELVEYWAHMVSVIPVEDRPWFRLRMQSGGPGNRTRRVMEEHPGYIEAVLKEVRERGPLSVSDLEDPGQRTGPWWGHGKGKTALEWLFAIGELVVVDRRNFTRVYDVAERWLPRHVLDAPTPSPEETMRELTRRAARHLGIATLADLADYWRVRTASIRPHVAALVAAGELEEVSAWGATAYLDPGAARPRRVAARALLSPFDSLIWERKRTQRLFDFDYRIEIYVPEPKRTYGYYVYPFLLGDEIAARVDIKADRQAGRLLAKGAFLEDHADPRRVAGELAAELRSMAGWLGLGEVEVGRKGDLAQELRKAM